MGESGWDAEADGGVGCLGGFAVTASLVTPRAGHNDKTKKLRPQMEMGRRAVGGVIVGFRFAEKYTEGKEG